MAADVSARIARRLLALATAAMPPSRRDWGRAMSAQLAYARSRGERARLVLGVVRVALLPPPGDAGYGRTAARAAALAVIAYVPLGVANYASNVVFPSSQDSTAVVLAGNAYLFAALMGAGALARYARPGLAAPVLAGMAAGLVIAVLAMATFTVIDNAFLPVVMHQQGKIDGFRASGMTSTRAYVNGQLKAAALGVAILMAVMGAVLAPLGAILAQEADLAWHRRRLSRER
ncbi:MAG TPA: hypothetical protein VHZ03_34450 [Trebonia sp.]|jgi:hypothetical protein|nr:hypothetical protein [Trebonia sp.]